MSESPITKGWEDTTFSLLDPEGTIVDWQM